MSKLNESKRALRERMLGYVKKREELNEQGSLSSEYIEFERFRKSRFTLKKEIAFLVLGLLCFVGGTGVLAYKALEYFSLEVFFFLGLFYLGIPLGIWIKQYFEREYERSFIKKKEDLVRAYKKYKQDDGGIGLYETMSYFNKNQEVVKWFSGESMKKDSEKLKEIEARILELKDLQTLAKKKKMDPWKFEEYVAKLYESYGYQADVTKGSNDEGIDIQLINQEGGKEVVQCKRYKSKITPAIVREFYGAMTHVSAEKGHIVTSGDVSKNARQWSEGKNIEFVIGTELVEMAKKTFK